MDKEFEALDKLEECANGMKDLPKSNWSDLAENEAELDLKIMDWVETIKFELFKGKQALTELQAIKETKPSEAMECVDVLKEDGCITTLYQGKALETIRQALLKAQELEKKNAEYKRVLKVIKDKCMWNDNLYLVDMSLNYDNYKQGAMLAIKNITQTNLSLKDLLAEEEFNLLKNYFNNTLFDLIEAGLVEKVKE